MDRQRDDGTRLIEARGWTFVREYVDNDITASGKKKRPAFEQMLRDIEAGTIDVIVSLSLDRLSRNRREQLHLVETCQEHSTLIALVRGSDIDLSTAIGRAVADMMAVPARLEIEQKSERHIDQIAQAARQGRMVGGRRAFGYRDGGMELDPVEAPFVKAMYSRFLAGESLGSITRWLNELEVTTPRGNRWRHQSVREVLANPRNAAIRGMRPVVNKKTGTRSQWHVEVGPAVWPPIVPEETWRATMQLIHDPNRAGNHAGFNSQTYLLTGIALCGVCDRPLIVGGMKGSKPTRDAAGRLRYRVMRCPSLRHVSRRADYIEAFVEQRVVGYFSKPGRPVFAARAEPGPDLDEVRLEATSLRARLQGLAADYADGVLDREQVRVTGARIRDRLAELDGVVAAVGAVDVTAKMRASADPEVTWDEELTLAEQRALIRRIMTIRVLPGTPGRLHGLRFHEDSVSITWHDDVQT